MDRFFIPRLGVLAVLGLAALLIGVIVLRSPDTHANLWNRLEDGYSRTEVGVVAAGGKTAVAEVKAGTANASLSFHAPIWLMVPQDGAMGQIADPGQRLYIASGCAKCHGLNGQGGVVGPPLAGMEPQIITAFARVGPGNMPAFTPHMLSDRELTEIGAYLKSQRPAVPVAEPAPVPAPAPAPVASTPPPTPKPTSTPPAPVAGTPPPTAAATPAAPASAAATSPPAPEAAPLANTISGQKLYTGKCAACHGDSAAGKYGPSLVGLDTEDIEQAVRQGKGAMPAFNASLITDQSLEALLAYIATLTSAPGR